MKALSHFKCSLLVWLLMLGFNAMAQPDLSVMSNGAPYIFIGNSQINTIQIQVSNNGDMDTVNGITLDFALDSLIDSSFALLEPVSSEWSCPNFSVNLSCSFIGNMTQNSTSILNLDVVVQSGVFSFSPAFGVLVTDINGDDINISDNEMFVDIEYLGAPTDFSLQANPPGDPVEFNAGGGGYQINYTVSNEINGFDEGDQTTVTFNYAVELINAVVTSTDSNWSCNQFTQQWVCDYLGVYPAGFSSDLTFNFNSPTTVGLVDSAIDVGVFNLLGDPNLSNNSLSTNINFVAVGSSADLDLSIDTNPPAQTNYNVGDVITLDLTLHNPFTSTGAPLNTTVTTNLPNEVVFSTAQVTNAPGWQCLYGGSGVVTCDSQGNTMAIGANVFIEISGVVSSATSVTSAFVNASVVSDFDPNPSNNTSNVSFGVTFQSADLSIAFTSLSGVYNQGDIISYDIQVANPMASLASPSDVEVIIDLPVEVIFDSVVTAGAPGWNCLHDSATTGGQISCDRGGAAFGSNSLHVFAVDVQAASPATNASAQATIGSLADTSPSNNLVVQSDVINALVTDFSIVKTVSANNFNVGDDFVYTLIVNNDSTSTGAPIDVVIKDQLPTEVVFNSFVVNSNMGTTVNCAHDGSNTGGLFSCNTVGTPFAVGEVVTIDINVTAFALGGAVNNSATVATSTDPNGITLNNISAAPAVVINAPLITTITATKLALVSGVAMTEVAYGEAFEYLLQVDNTGVNDAINTHVTDTLPTDVTLVGFVTTGWSCLPMALNAVGETVDCTMNSPLATGANSQVILNVVATTNTTVNSIINQMEASGDNTGPQVTSLHTLNLQNSMADLTVSQTPEPVDASSAVDFNLNFVNTGTSSLTGVQVDSVLPTDFIYNGFSADPGVSCSESSGTVSCNFLNPLLVNNAINITLNLTAAEVLITNQNYELQVSANANELFSPVLRTLAVSFLNSDYNVSLLSADPQVDPGESFTHLMSISNTGNNNLTSVQAVFSFPSYVEMIEAQTNDMSCSSVGGGLACVNLQPLLIGEQLLVSFVMQSNGSNSIAATQVSVNGDGISKSASASTQINQGVILANDLALIKSVSVQQVSQQGAFSYVFDVVNEGTNNQTNFVLVDEMPAGVVFETANGNGWTCTGNATISCQFNGVLASGAQSRLIMDVLAPAVTGVVTNTARITSVDENLSNNQSTAAVEVVAGVGDVTAIADLAIQVAASHLDVINTEQLTWTIDVKNLGPDTAENVRIENQFPLGFVAEDVMVEGGVTCAMLSESLVCEVASMTINQNIQISLVGGFNNGFEGLLMNLVDVTSDAIDPNLSNNQSQAQVNVTLAENLTVDLALELMTAPQNIRQGDVFELKFKTKNFGPNSAVEPTVSASLSGLISQVQIINSGQWACQVNSSTLTCQYPGRYLVGMEQVIVMNVITEQIEQTSQPLVFNAIIESNATEVNPANNLIGLTNEVLRTPNEDEIFNVFAEAVGTGASETVMQTIRNVSSYCARKYFMAIEGLCEEMIAGARTENRADIINLMEEITPNEVVGQSTSASEIITSQFSNVGSRLSELRGGSGSGFSVSGLNGRYGNESIPLGMLAYLNQSADEQQGVDNINDFISPWGFFVNGSISMGERDATGRELGFDFDTYGLTAGVDYRFSPTKVAGVAIGYANFDSKIEDEAEMKSTALTLTGYGSFYVKDNFYVDARLSYGTPDFEQKRRINFALDNIAIDRVATGKTDAAQYSFAMSLGYHFNKNSWNITPNASVQYARTTIDAFQESGAGGFNFLFQEQEIKSMIWSVGTSVSRAFSLKKGIISPQFDFNLSRETENDGGLIEARFLTAPADEIFYIETDEPDRTYGSAGVGLVFIGANGKQAYINYRSIFGLEGFTRGTINLGARFEF